jgi:hypothetical protein
MTALMLRSGDQTQIRRLPGAPQNSFKLARIPRLKHHPIRLAATLSFDPDGVIAFHEDLSVLY